MTWFIKQASVGQWCANQISCRFYLLWAINKNVWLSSSSLQVMSLEGVWNSKSCSQVPHYCKCSSYTGNQRDNSCSKNGPVGQNVTKDAQRRKGINKEEQGLTYESLMENTAPLNLLHHKAKNDKKAKKPVSWICECWIVAKTLIYPEL